MKRYILTILLLALLASPVFASTDITGRPTSYWLTGNPDKDNAWAWMKHIDNNVLGPMGTGKTFYVDSNVNIEGGGLTVDSAKDTINEAVALTVADRGDVIYVLQGHKEDGVVGTAAIFTVGTSGVTIIGVGPGSLKPTFDYNYTSNTCVVSADNVRLHNLRFVPSISAVTIGVEVSSGADYAHISNCDFGYVETSTDEFAIALKVGTSTGAVVENNFFDSSTEAAVTAITFEAATGLIIRGNRIYGDCSTACINNAITLAEDILIEDNILWNGDTAALKTEPVIEVMAATVGITRRNYVACNVGTVAAAFDGDLLFNFGNYYTEKQAGAYTAFALDMVAASTTQMITSVVAGDEE